MATTTTKEPAKALSPAELVEELLDIANDVYDHKVENEVREATRRLEAARAKANRLAEKKLRILRAATIEQAEAILKESPADENLKKLCQRVTGWKPLQENGGTDEEIKALLSKWPKNHVRGVPSAHSGYGSNQHYAWVDPDKSAENPAHLSGEKLISAVRRVMGIGKPVAPKPETKKPAKAPAARLSSPKSAKSKPKAAAATPAKADPADAGGDGDDDAGGAEDAAREKFGRQAAATTVEDLRQQLAFTEKRTAPNPDGLDDIRRDVLASELRRRGKLPKKAAPASGGVKHRAQTWGQWAATLRAINGRIDLDPNLPDKAAPDERERFFLDQFARKRRPADARDAWQKLEQGRPPAGPLPSVAALDLPQTPMPTAGNEAPTRLEPRSYQDPAEVGVTPAELAGAMDRLKLRPPSPHEKAPLVAMVKPMRLRDGRWYAVIGGRVWNVDRPFRRVETYTLRRLYDPVEWQDKTYATWAGLPGADKLAPEDVPVAGLSVDDADAGDGPSIAWILGGEADQLHVDVIGEPAAKVIETKALGPADEPAEDYDPSDPPAAVRAAHDALDLADGFADPNVDGRGVFVSGVEEVWAWRDKRGEVRIRVAQGADQLWRTGHQVEFVGADVWQADTEQAVIWASQAVESREYAIRARANVLLNRLRAGDGVGPSGKWSTRQKAVYGAAIKALENFIAHNPACRQKPRAAAKAG